MLKLSKPTRSGTRSLTFTLPQDQLKGTVSVVGTFNDWTPGAHTLRKRSNGTASVQVKVPAGTDVTFRYLADGGRWFDDHSADTITSQGSVVHA
ncbi:MAG: isoamylase early set domain-containing protein [Micrococcales bacterium]|nr:isoamylase early set domain-containing protein [Micrococcales bacterium]MCL2667559.1 isoamylase early set domain-containing protein [Micrococcales bacterium]